MRYLTIILLFISSLAMAQRPYLFPTIADAASNTYIGIGAYVQTQGYSASGDGGGALYRMTAIGSAPMAADSGYVYPVTAGKVLVQVLEDEYLRTATYGVVCGSSAQATNNFNRLQRFFNAINTLDKQAFVNGCNDTIYVNFTSALTTTLTSHDKFVMRGEGADVTRIKATAGSIDFGFSDAAKVNLFDLYLHGYDATAFGGIGGADQSLTYVNDTLTISGGNFVVITGGGGGGTDDQTISIDSNAFKYTLSIESGNSVTFAKVTDTDTDDQTLSFSSPNLSISEGNSVDLSALQDGTGTDDQTLTLDSVSGTYNLTIESGNTVKIKRDTDTDDQTLSVDSTAYKYTITIADGNAIDFGKSQDNSVSNELQTIALDSVSGTYNLTLSNGGGTVKIKRDTDTDDQTLSLVTNTLSISEGNSVDLAAYLDNTDDQVISIDSNATTYTLTLESGGSIKILKSVNTDAQTLSFSNPNLSISGGNSVDISGIDTDTDDQTLSIDSNAYKYTLTIADGNSVTLGKSQDNSITNEIQNLSWNSSTGDLSISSGTGANLDGRYLTAEVDGSVSNELQTVSNTSDATTHTITLSNSGGSLQLVEGSGVTLTTTGTALDGVVTIAASGATGEANTASNLGAGAGVYEQKVSLDLQFNSLVSESTSQLTIAEDDPNNTIDFTILTGAVADAAATLTTGDHVFDYIAAQGFLTAEVDGSITNEGSLTVAAGTATTSLIQSNTSASTDVTLSVSGEGLSISEASNTITHTLDVDAAGIDINTYTPTNGGSISVDFESKARKIIEINCTSITTGFTMNVSNGWNTAGKAAVYNIRFYNSGTGTKTVTLDAGDTWYDEAGTAITTLSLEANTDKIFTIYTENGSTWYSME